MTNSLWDYNTRSSFLSAVCFRSDLVWYIQLTFLQNHNSTEGMVIFLGSSYDGLIDVNVTNCLIYEDVNSNYKQYFVILCCCKNDLKFREIQQCLSSILSQKNEFLLFPKVTVFNVYITVTAVAKKRSIYIMHDFICTCIAYYVVLTYQ